MYAAWLAKARICIPFLRKTGRLYRRGLDPATGRGARGAARAHGRVRLCGHRARRLFHRVRRAAEAARAAYSAGAAIAAGIVVPKYVFFYEVEGNEAVPSAQILRELRELGVGFGTYGPSIKPQELKNQMLLRIPKLQWLTVQQSGMCARVVVRERPDKAPVLDRKVPTDVIASRAGVLTRVEAVAGNCLCAPGQAVAGGELLVSAYTDFGFKTQVTAARAEIYARDRSGRPCASYRRRSRSRRTARLRVMRSVCLSDGGAFRFSARTYRKDFTKKRQKRGF